MRSTYHSIIRTILLTYSIIIGIALAYVPYQYTCTIIFYVLLNVPHHYAYCIIKRIPYFYIRIHMILLYALHYYTYHIFIRNALLYVLYDYTYDIILYIIRMHYFTLQISHYYACNILLICVLFIIRIELLNVLCHCWYFIYHIICECSPFEQAICR